MKKIMMALMLCTSFIYLTAFAEDDSSDAHIANTLTVLFKMIDENTMNANNYQQTTFVYNGMPVTAFKCKTSNWVGFFKQLSAKDLPANALNAIENEYKNYSIVNVTMYFSNEGDIDYFAEINLNKQCIILKIDAPGSIKVFNRMPGK